MATLEIGTKSAAVVWKFSVAGKPVLDGNGVSFFRLSNPLIAGQLLRIKAEGKVQISTVISGTR